MKAAVTPCCLHNCANSLGSHFGRSTTVAPTIAEPLGLFDCCGVSDGAAAVIVTRPDIARSLGKRDLVRRLVGSLEADTSKLQRLGWQAPYPARRALALTGEWFATG